MATRKMKPSGVEWLGVIPEEWNISNISGLYTLRNQKVSDRDYPPLSVTKQGVLPQLDTVAKTNAHDDRKLVRKGDFAINSRSDRRGSCGVSQYDGSVSLINTVLKPREQMHSGYYDWLFHTTQFADEFYKNGHGIVDDLWTTNWQDMKKICVPSPTLSEQQFISEFLDDKCGKIDGLISDIQAQIATLEQYRRSVITECITNKTLNVNNTRIGYEAYIRARLGWKGLKAEEYVENGHPFLSAFNIVNNKLCWNDLNFITDKRYDESPEIKLRIGDIILVKDGAGIGKCARINNLPYGTATTNSSLAVITTKSNLDSRYLYYILLSSIFQNYILQVLNGMGVPHLTQEELRKIKIRIPDLKAQLEIADSLDAKCFEIDSAITDKQAQIATLEQYKKSLIFEYVTGKKEIA